MFDWLSDPQAWISLLTLSVLEIVLGIDNIIFISILAGKLPPAEQPRARSLGLAGAFVSRNSAAAVHHLGHAAHASAVRVVGARVFGA
jgi:predicted tellurium resistance membrane protein TerC